MDLKKKWNEIPQRIKITLISAAAVVFVALIGVVVINSRQLKIELLENAEVNVNETADNYQFIKSIKNGKVLTEKTAIDTQTVGERNIVLTVKPIFGTEKEFRFSIFVVDHESPKITFSDHLVASVCEEKDLLEGVSVTDNSNEEITVSVEGSYDINKIGEYRLKYVATDSSQNRTEEEFTLSVEDRESPKIKFKKSLETTKGTKIDLLKGVSATDNSNEEITVSVEGSYDINKVGVYKLKYVASDSSDNKTEEAFTLTVKDVVASSGGSTQSNRTENTGSATFTTPKGFSGVTKNGVTYVNGYLIANKTYGLPSSYGSGITGETQSAFNTMAAAAKKDGIKLYISSGFRSYSLQTRVYNNYVNRDGVAEADTYSARPGHSEHQSGLALDLNTIGNSFAGTPEAIWLNNNCYKYGFILRYPKGKSNETGYMYEPWHFRYVGEELATKLYNGGDWITMEDYFGITSKY